MRNGHGRARGVGAAPRRRRSNEAIFNGEFQFRESHTPAETKKTPDQIPDTNEGFYIDLCDRFVVFTVVSLVSRFLLLLTFFTVENRGPGSGGAAVPRLVPRPPSGCAVFSANVQVVNIR